MDKKRKDGYITGIVCLLIFSIFLIFIINNGWNLSTQILLIFDIFFGSLGFGSLWKPESIGEIASQILKNISKSVEEESDSHNKQIQRKSSGVQVMASHGAKVNINIPSKKKVQPQNPPVEEEEKEILRKETIEVNPSDSYFYEFEFSKGDHLKGEISSTSSIDVYFLDELNFDKWNRGRKYFEAEDSNEAILEANIDYLAPKRGNWYLIIENNGRKSATAKVLLY